MAPQRFSQLVIARNIRLFVVVKFHGSGKTRMTERQGGTPGVTQYLFFKTSTYIKKNLGKVVTDLKLMVKKIRFRKNV